MGVQREHFSYLLSSKRHDLLEIIFPSLVHVIFQVLEELKATTLMRHNVFEQAESVSSYALILVTVTAQC